NQYQLNIYEFELHPYNNVLGGDCGLRTVKLYDKDKNNAIFIDVYYENEVEPEGDIVFGFRLIAKRNSHRFDALQWHTCFEDIGNHFNDSLLDAIDDGKYDEYLNNPLGSQVWLKTTCDKWDDGDCINKTDDYPKGDISLCTNFTYGGTSDRDVTMDTKLYRKMTMDAKNGQCCGTDGDVWGRIKLYVRDEDAGINYFLYENTHQHIQGRQYNYQNSDYFTEELKLIAGHRYHMRILLYGRIEQGLRSRNGYVELKIHTDEPIRFIFGKDGGIEDE
ncbi:MAG: hypothetical protein U9P37_04930, partial [Pseudomonadota bacterium]|nr:hypothetical protein [Pseudomonadota bacterium]